MKRTGTLALLLAVLILGLFATACGSASTDATATPVGATGSGDTTPGASASTPGSTSGGGSGATTATQEVKLGEAFDLGGYSMTLTSAKFEDGSLKALFTVDNSKGTDAASVRPTGFSATDADGTAMDADIICSTLPALVDPGKTVDGPQCWKSNGNEKTTGVKIHYDGGRSVGKILTWILP
jgi:hypothetical protein